MKKIILAVMMLVVCSLGYAEEYIGEVEELVMDSHDFSKSESKYSINGKELKFEKKFLKFWNKKEKIELRVGQKIKVNGKKKGEEITVNLSEQGSLETLEEGALPSPAIGNFNTALISVHFSGGTDAITPSTYDQWLFQDISNYIKLQSDYQANIYGTTFGPIKISFLAFSPCEYTKWSQEVDHKLLAQGIDVTLYDKIVYTFPDSNSCSKLYGGMGQVGGKRAWVFYNNNSSIIAHEYGHLLGMSHASTPSAEYGDLSDFMGNNWKTGLKGPNKVHNIQNQWIDDAETVIRPSNQTYALKDQVLKVPITTYPPTAYYISFRADLGNKIQIHKWPGWGKTILVKTMIPGNSFEDTTNKIKVKYNILNLDTAEVLVILT